MPRSATARKRNQLAPIAALLAAPIPDIELLIGAMANPDEGIRFVLGILRKAGQWLSEVQSVLFNKLKWKLADAKNWLRDHGFDPAKLDEGATFWRFRQKGPGRYKEYATIVPGGQAARNPQDTSPSGLGHMLGRAHAGERMRGNLPRTPLESSSQRLLELARYFFDHNKAAWGFAESSFKTFADFFTDGYRSRIKEQWGGYRNPQPRHGGCRMATRATRGKRHATNPRGRLADYWRVALFNKRTGEYWGAITAKDRNDAEQIAAEERAKGELEARVMEPLKRWRNPESEAAALYEDFHGAAPEHTKRIVTEREERDWLVLLGLGARIKF